ncbi:MAG TPA: hypothetical protein VIX82_10685, partial [Solirubrobacteraceae bacterium]
MSDSQTDLPGGDGREARTGVFPAARGVRAMRRGAHGGPPRAGKHAESGHELGVLDGLAALSLDALSSVAYGPEAMAVVLVAAGAGALTDILPLTVVIAAML